MWQFMLAAAVAGSGILAKKLIFNPNGFKTLSDSKPQRQISGPQSMKESVQSQDSNFLSIGRLHQENCGEADSVGSVFRFSSTCVAEQSSKISRKKMESFKRAGKAKFEKKCGIMGCEKKGWVVDQRGSGNGRRFSVCLKKRRTSKNASGKCTSCTAKGNSFFSWGLSVGIMYMMSTGKAEISRLNFAMDETARVVQELKSELSRRKAFHGLDVPNLTTVLEAALMNHGGNNHDQVEMDSISAKSDALNVIHLLQAPDAKCGSSVLTEDQLHEVMEMDQLEAELETELQRLPCGTMEEGFNFYEQTEAFETELPGGQYEDAQNLNSYQSSGVSPTELQEKLSHLLIEQQESQIAELESELHRTHSKLYEKEAELQALKECVRRLTNFSLGSASDDDTEVQRENEKMHCAQEMGCGACKSAVGMKRAWSSTLTAPPGETLNKKQ